MLGVIVKLQTMLCCQMLIALNALEHGPDSTKNHTALCVCVGVWFPATALTSPTLCVSMCATALNPLKRVMKPRDLEPVC